MLHHLKTTLFHYGVVGVVSYRRLAPERLPGLLMGGFLGLVAGFFVSGILLMLMGVVRRRRQARR